MYTSIEYSHDPDSLKGNKFRDLAPPGTYRTSTAFNSAYSLNPLRGQPPLASAPASSFLRDTSNFSQHFPIDAFSHPSQPGNQQQHVSSTYDPIHSTRNAFEYTSSQPPIGPPSLPSSNKPAFNVDPFGSGAGAPSMLPPHKANGVLPGQGAQVVPSSQHGVFTSGEIPASYLNGGSHHQTMQSQTPYGPHIPAKAMSGNQTTPTQTSAVQVAPQEEISTIFVVGFPDDMQEREFQNMFTFSPGFEAATLKIPNKDMSSYGQGLSQANSFRQGGFSHTHGGVNDPYNLVTINQGGVVVDNGRDGTTSSWQPNDEPHFSHLLSGGSNTSANNRKQIIGFAKFRTRAEALEARNTLQGRRVDIEKGAVLKAEMAKKNLHTKRGIGPLPLQLSSVVGSTNGAVPLDSLGGVQSISSLHPAGAPPGLGAMGSEVLSARDRELGTMGVIARRERAEAREDELDLRKASIVGGFSRGARERAEEEERRWKEKAELGDRNSRPRASEAQIFDAFHSVPANQRPTGNSLMAAAGSENGHMNHPQRGSISAWGPILGREAPRKPTLPSSLPPRPPSPSQSQQSPPAHEASAFASNASIGSFSPDAQSALLPVHPSLPSRPQHLSHPEDEAGDITILPSSGSSAVSADGDDEGGLSDPAHNTAGPAPLQSLPATGQTSPQLPSPASGSSSNQSRSGAIDQNPPINTLYVGNLPSSPPPVGYPHNSLEDSLRELFNRQPGFRKLCFRQKSNGPMCFVEFVDVPYAKKALDELYGETLGGLVKNGGIRLSYSKNPLGVRTPTNPGQHHTQIGSAFAGSGFNVEAFQARSFNDVELNFRSHRDGVVSPTSSVFPYSMNSPPRFVSPPPFSASSIFPRQSANLSHGSQSAGYSSPPTFSPPPGFSHFSLQHLPSHQQQTLSSVNQIPEHEQNPQIHSHNSNNGSFVSSDIHQQHSSPAPSPIVQSGP